MKLCQMFICNILTSKRTIYTYNYYYYSLIIIIILVTVAVSFAFLNKCIDKEASMIFLVN